MFGEGGRSYRVVHGLKRALIVIPVVLLVVLVLHPDTAWLVRTQCRLLYSPRDTYVAFKEYQPANKPQPAWLRHRLAEVARSHSDDYLIQLAWAIEQHHPSDVNLRDLLPRFGKRPALLAHILRYDTTKRVHIRRTEEWAFYPPRERPNPQSLVPPSPEYLALYDRVASEGERLDPDNAYFPLMRAVGLFAAHRDREAMEAIERASRKPRWEDYTGEEAEARLHLLTNALGRQTAISQFLGASAVIEPHWGAIRSVARLVLYFASEKEKRKEHQGAAALRLAMLRCASLIRAQSRSSVGVLVAFAVGEVSVASPGTPRRPNETAEQRRLKNRQRFLDSLHRLEEDAAARWAGHEFAAVDEARAIIREGMAPQTWLRMPLKVVRAWTVNMLLLFLFWGMLLLWLVYTAVARTALRRGIASYLVLLATLFGVGVLVLLSPWADFPAQALVTLAYILDLEGNQLSFVVVPPLVFRLVAAIIIIFLLLMTVTAVGVYGLVRGQEPDAALVEGVRRGGLSAAGVLLVFYLLSVLQTARLESAWQHDLQALRQHEGKYYAGQLGKIWPL